MLRIVIVEAVQIGVDGMAELVSYIKEKVAYCA